MKILAIDSSGLIASAALATEDAVLAEYTTNYKKTHSQTLLPMIDEIDIFVLKLGIASSLSTVPAASPTPLSAMFATGIPAAAINGIKVIVTLSPTPPVECLSRTKFWSSPKSTYFPVFASASVKLTVSSKDKPLKYTAINHDAI